MGDQEIEDTLGEGEAEQYEDQETQLLQHFQAQDEHGNTIVLTAEQVQSYQEQLAQQLEGGEEGMIFHTSEDAEDQMVNEILDGEHELATQEILGVEEDDGTHHVTSEELQELITLHTDEEGNIITGHEHVEEHEHMGLEHVDVRLFTQCCDSLAQIRYPIFHVAL